MKTFRFRKSTLSEFVTKSRKQEYIPIAGNSNISSAKALSRDREEKTVASCNRSIVTATALFALYTVAFCATSCESRTTRAITRNGLWGASTMTRLEKQRPLFRFFVPGPLIVSASTVPLIVSRFHHNNRLEASNRIRLEFFDSPYKSIITESLFLSNVERYRGGSQHNINQQRWNSSNHHKDNDRQNEKDQKDDDDRKANNLSTSLVQSQNRVTKVVRQGAGAMFSVVGFLGSSFASFATDRRSFEDRFVEPIRALRIYLKTSGVDDELSKSLNRRLGINLCLLGRVHLYQAAEEELAAIKSARKKKKRRRIESYFDPLSSSSSSKINGSFLEEARRYMKYATAVYGQAMINAAEVDAQGRLDGKVGRVTKETISAHISVPVEGIKLMDVSTLEGDSSHLRHMVIVDHENEKVVLSIRGTFSLEEIVLDVVADSREFCGGEAHSGMATMAERVWAAAGPTVQTELEGNPGYEFILTGHSLGAGAACLVTILVQSKRLLSNEQKIRCFAYASPPVYTPLEFVPKSVESTTNFVHENDVVPFLSIQKVRKLFSSLRAVDLYARNHMSKRERYKLILGASEAPKDLIAAVLEAEGKRLVPKKGAPTLFIPAERTVWLKEKRNEEEEEENIGVSYRYDLSNAREMSQREIRVYPDMLVDHFPARYEHAFAHLEKPVDEED